jgi:hypothetical protein
VPLFTLVLLYKDKDKDKRCVSLMSLEKEVEITNKSNSLEYGIVHFGKFS